MRRLKLAILGIALLFAVGCASTTARAVRYENDCDFHKSHYTDVCSAAQPPAGCLAYGTAVNTFERDLARFVYFGDVTLKQKRTGAAPLQFRQITADDKSVAKAAVK